jgi:SAM-dependent methyltransferase
MYLFQSRVVLVGVLLAAAMPTRHVVAQPAPASAVELLRREAAALGSVVESKLARNVLEATAELPAISPRTLFVDEARRRYFTEAAAASLGSEARGKLTRFPVDETFYYTTKYGSPLAYVRPFDLLGQFGPETVAGRRVFDFGYGTIGHLRLLASLGADVTGVDVDPLLSALYSQPEDQGPIKKGRGQTGRVRLIEGRFPADQAVTTAVGKGFDLIISKNTLKKGYVHPERPVEKRRLLNLDVDDEAFVRALITVLKPGGWVMIYNITPAPSPPDQPYKNWADGRCPFPRPVWEAAGFDVVAFDRDDTPAIRRIAAALGWDKGPAPIDLKNDLFAQYSLMRKKQAH